MIHLDLDSGDTLMAKRRQLTTRLPIFTFSSGVGRQAPTKRLPTEAENIDNCFVTLEKSISKRSGFEFLSSQVDGVFELGVEADGSQDLWYYWFDISDEIRYLIIIDYSIDATDLLRVFKITNNTWQDITSLVGAIPTEVREYLTYRPNTSVKARDALKAVSIGQSIVILNRFVKAGFTSEDVGDAFDLTKDLDSQAQIFQAGDTFNDFTIYDTEGGSGDPLKVTVNINQTGGVASLKSVEQNGSGYKLNDVITIINDVGTSAKFRLVDTVNFGYTLSGELSNEKDLIGRKIDYYTPLTQDPENKAKEYSQYADNLTGDEVIYSLPDVGAERKVYECIKDIDPTPPDVGASGVNLGGTGPQRPLADNGDLNSEYWIEKRDCTLLLVDDFFYPDPEKPELGQAVPDFSKIKFPPLDTDMFANNGFATANANDRTEQTLAAYYPNKGDPNGRGKIYFSAIAFAGTTPGFYRIISQNPESGGEGKPYTQKVRTPDEHSVFDKKRMPIRLTLENQNEFSLDTIDWSSRTTGNNNNNPGPVIFKTKGEDRKLRNIELNSIAFYRGRLFLSAADTVFSSRVNKFQDLWLGDPSNITDTDPIDLQASSNRYAKINAMLPFANSLFINTDSDTQFELLGSENRITPLTAELAPTAFYATSPVIDPVLMGTQIYFPAPSKMYIYFSRETASLNNAIEVSQHCPDYLPKNMGPLTVAGSRNSIFILDDDNLNYIYVYTNRFAADQVTQNAFHRWILQDNAKVMSLSFYDDFLYTVVGIETDGVTRLYLQKVAANDENEFFPRLDNRVKFTVTEDNTTYDSVSNTTTFTMELKYNSFDQCVLFDGFDDENFTIVNIVSQTINDNTLSLVLSGDYSNSGNVLYFGNKYTMNVELSEIFYRDQQNNVIDGILSLRTIHLRHSKTGNYKIITTRKGRTPMITEFNNAQTGARDSVFPTDVITSSGETVAKIMSFSHDANIKIQSDSPTPCNITNVELKGKFKPVFSSLDK